MDLEDKIIVCEDCHKEFTHSVEDQQRYAERGFTADPKRCRECRQARKDKAAASQAAGGPPRREGGGGPRRPSGGPRREGGFRGEGGGRPPRHGGDGGRDRGPPRGEGGYSGGGGHKKSFNVVCAACGAPTTVPFERSAVGTIWRTLAGKRTLV